MLDDAFLFRGNEVMTEFPFYWVAMKTSIEISRGNSGGISWPIARVAYDIVRLFIHRPQPTRPLHLRKPINSLGLIGQHLQHQMRFLASECQACFCTFTSHD